MDRHPTEDPLVAAFLTELESVPWFGNVGKPMPADAGVKQIFRWEDWPGPEEPSILELSQRQQSLYDEVMAQSCGNRQRLSELWDRIHDMVFKRASTAAPYDAMEDAWHAPTAAVWQAAWTAGLMGLCLYLRRPVPADLQEQWRWFVAGRWPSGYATVWANEQLGPLLVY